MVAVIASKLSKVGFTAVRGHSSGKTDSLPAAASEVQKLAADKPELSTLEYREAKKIDIPVTDGMTGNWRAVAYEANVEELSDTDFPAKLCFYSDDEEATQHCFKGIAARTDHTWNCQFVRDLSVTTYFSEEVYLGRGSVCFNVPWRREWGTRFDHPLGVQERGPRIC